MKSILVISIVLLALVLGDGHDFLEDGHDSSINRLKRKIDDPEWNDWSGWSSCTKSCGGGIQSRTRTCRGGSNGQTCTGQAKEEKQCNQQSCPGQWSQWSQWSTCVNKDQSRTRQCAGGGACSGLPRETRSCRSGSWSAWSLWGSCSVTCGPPNGQQTRTRTCQGGTDCPNLQTNTEKRQCFPQPPQCSAKSKWTDWSQWSKCSRTCNGGDQFRNRTCLLDEPANQTKGSPACVGPNRETQKCNTLACPTAKWSDWSNWTPCSITCGTGGRQSRKRNCIGVGGVKCQGPSEETKSCNAAKSCPEIGRWNEWSPWSACTKSCANGDQTRQRTCVGGRPGSQGCPGSEKENRQCNQQSCPTWSEWSWAGQCSATCGNGFRRRTRNCNGGTGCIGPSDETVTCTNNACKIASFMG